MEDLNAETQTIVYLTPQSSPQEPIIPVTDSRIDPVTAAAIGRPGTKLLLQPDRQEELNMCGAEAKLLVSGRHDNKRIDGRLGKPAFLLWRDEAVLRAELDVAKRKPAVAPIRHGIALRDDCGELEVWECPIVHLKTRENTAPTASIVRSLRKQVDLEMLERNRFRVIRSKRRTGDGWRCQDCSDYESCRPQPALG